MATAGTGAFAEFLDDYYSECDQHLLAVRRDLLGLESAPDPVLVDDLFRRVHTIKGLSGMVGVRPAVELAHQMETVLRPLREQGRLDPGTLDALTAGARLLEQVLAGHRLSQPAPDIAPALERLSAAAGTSDVAVRPTASPGLPFALAPAEQARLEAALEGGARLWRVEFTPSRDLAARGVNVNTVRARLQSLGQLVHATPRTQPEPSGSGREDASPASGPKGGTVVFEFVVASAAAPDDLGPLAADGMVVSPYSPPTRPSSPPPEDRPEGTAPAAAWPPSGGNVPAGAEGLAPANTVRVDLARLDELLRLVGRLVISRAQLEEAIGRVESLLPVPEWRALHDISAAFDRQLRGLRERVVGARLVPVGDVLERMRFAALDLARDQQKQLVVDLAGQETELDRFVVEQVLDPLLHLVRNAVGHGLERPDERLAAGKPPAGHLLLRAAGAGEQILIDVQDDGPGIDLSLVAARARARGLLAPDETLSADDPLLLDVLCAPGLTTREQADLTSGRGLGLVIVRSRVEGLGGVLSVSTQEGRGTCFTIQLPLTLALADALLVMAAGRVFAVPQSAIREVLEVPPGATVPLDANGDEALPYRGGVLPVVRLAHLFHLDGPGDGGPAYALVVGGGAARAGMIVDRILARRVIMAQALDDPWLRVRGVTGATQLGDGRIAPILDAPVLTRPLQALYPGTTAARAARSEGEESMDRIASPPPSQPYILFRLADATYGLPSRVIRHVEMLEHLLPLPDVLPFVEGVVLSRGRMIPAISLRARFGFERIPYDLHTRLVVVDDGDREVGLIVDSAREFRSIPDDAIRSAPEAIAGMRGDWLAGIATVGEGRLLLILSVERVLSLAPEELPAGAEDVHGEGEAG